MVELRAWPEPTAPSPGRLLRGQPVTIVLVTANWCELRLPMQLEAWTPAASVQDGRITGGSTLLYSRPDSAGIAFGMLETGTPVRVLRVLKPDWLQLAPPPEVTVWVPRMAVVIHNRPPTVSRIAPQTVSEDSGPLRIAFEVDEGHGLHEDAQRLSVAVSSSNITAVPNDHILVECADDDTDAQGGEITIMPAAEQNGTAVIKVHVSDGEDVAEEKFTVSLIAVNDPPILPAIADMAIREDQIAIRIAFTADEGGGSDEDSQVVAITASSSNPQLVPDENIAIQFRDDATDATGGLIDITPVADANGVTTITLSAYDGTTETQRQFRFTVEPVDDPPVLSPIGEQTTNEDVPIIDLPIQVDEGGGGDEDDAVVTVRAFSSNPILIPADNIVIKLRDDASDCGNGAIDLMPMPNENGTATITLQATDGATVSTQAFTLTVKAVNDTPTLSQIADQSTYEDVPVRGIAFLVDEGGADDEDPQEIVITASSSNQDLVPDANLLITFDDGPADARSGTLDVTPARHKTGVATITVAANDRFQTAIIRFQITVTPVNDPPALAEMSDRTIVEDQPLTALPLAVDEGGDVDEDSQILTIAVRSSNLQLVNPVENVRIQFTDGAANAPAGRMDVMPAPNQNGAAEITVAVSDGLSTTEQSFTLTVQPSNDPPVIAPIADQWIEEDSAASVLTFIVDEGGSGDEDAQILVLTARSNSDLLPAENLEVYGADGETDAAFGAIGIHPAADKAGTAVVTITASDGVSSVSREFRVTVNPVNDPPVVSSIPDQRTQEGIPLSGIRFSASEGGDVDEYVQPLTLSALSSNTELLPDKSIAVDFMDGAGGAKSGTVTLTPIPGAVGEATVTLVADDGTETAQTQFRFEVTPVDDPPVIEPIPDQRILEDTMVQGLPFTVDEGGGGDEDVQQVTVTVSSSNQLLLPDGNITIQFADGESDAGSGRVDLRPAANQSGETTVTVTANDGHTTSEVAFAVTVAPIADAPVLLPMADVRLPEDAADVELKYGIDASIDREVGQRAMTVRAVSVNTLLVPEQQVQTEMPEYDPISGRYSGIIRLRPAANENGVGVIRVTAVSGTLVAETTFSIYVEAMDDPPFLSTIADQTTTEDTTIRGISFAVDEGGGSDEDRQVLQLTATSSNTELIADRQIWIDLHDGATDATTGSLAVTPAANAFGRSTLTLTLSDGTHAVTTSFLMTVEAVNDPPTIAAIPAQITTESTPLTGIRFTADEGGGADEDAQVLSVSTTSTTIALLPISNVIVNFYDSERDAAEGTIELFPVQGQAGESIVSVTVNDGETSATTTFPFTVRPVNDLPVALSDSITTGEDQAVQGKLQALDAEDDPLTYEIVTAPRMGVIDMTTLAGNGYTYAPAANWNGADSFTFVANDGKARSSEATVTVTVTPTNDPPAIAEIERQYIDEDQRLAGLMVTVDEGGGGDEDSQIVRLSASSSNPQLLPADHVIVSCADDAGDVAGGSIEIRPMENRFGTAVIALTVDDGENVANTSFDVVVESANDPPTIDPIPDVITDEDTPTGTLTLRVDEGGGDDEDVQILRLSASSSNQDLVPNENLLVTVADDSTDSREATLEIRPNAGRNGTATITVTVDDGQASVDGRFQVTVNPANDPPEITDVVAALSIDEDAGPGEIAFTANAGGGPAEARQPLRVAATSADATIIPADGILVQFPQGSPGPASGKIRFSPALDRHGQTTMTIRVDDGSATTERPVEIHIEAVNDPPIVVAIPDQVAQEDAQSIRIPFAPDEGGGSDEDRQVLAITAASSVPDLVANDAITIAFSDNEADAAGGILEIRPVENAWGETEITLTISDGSASVTELFQLTIEPVNDPPTVEDFSISTEEGMGVSGLFRALDRDRDGLRFSIVQPPSKGKITAGGERERSFSYLPNAGATGHDTFTYQAHDDVADSNVGTVTVTIAQIDDEPTVSDIPDQTSIEDAVIEIAFTAAPGRGDDERDQPLNITVSSSNAKLMPDENVSVHLDSGATTRNGTMILRPAPETSGETTITVRATDGRQQLTKTFLLTVETIDDPPTISALPDQVTTEDASLTGIPFVVDEGGGVDEDSQTLRVLASSSNAQLVPDANIVVQFHDGKGDAKGGTIDIAPLANQHGSAIITIAVQDGANSVEKTFTLTVQPVNDPPEFLPLANQSVDEGTAVHGIPLIVDEGGGADEDVQTLKATVSSSNTELLPIVNIDVYLNDSESDAVKGLLNIRAVADRSGTSTVTVTLDDGFDTVSRSFLLSVDPIDEPPTISYIADPFTDEDIPLVGIPFELDEGGGADEDAQTILLTVSSSNPALAPDEKLVVHFTDGTGDAGAGTLDIYPLPERFGEAVITLTAYDGNIYTRRSCTLHVRSVNDRPRAYDDRFVTEPNVSINGILRGDDLEVTDVRYDIVQSATKGDVYITSDVTGAFVYRPHSGATGTDTFLYKVSDGATDSHKATVTILITKE